MEDDPPTDDTWKSWFQLYGPKLLRMKGILNVYFQGDMEAAPALAGQSAGLIDSVKSAKDIIEDTVAQFFEISQRMGDLAKQRSFS